METLPGASRYFACLRSATTADTLLAAAILCNKQSTICSLHTVPCKMLPAVSMSKYLRMLRKSCLLLVI